MAEGTGRGWANRIVGYGEETPDQLLANERQWRLHPGRQQDALLGVLREVGLVQNILVNRRTSGAWPEGDRGVATVVDGHLRVALAMRDEQARVPVTYVELDPGEEAEVLATFDPVGSLASSDGARLDALLREVQTGETGVQAMLSGLAEGAGLIPPDGAGLPECDEHIADDAADDLGYIICPQCGHKWLR